MTDYVLQQIITKARAAKNGGFGVLSTGEKLAAALVLNRADWLASMNYTMAEAIERVGPSWLERVPEAAKLLAYEAELADGLDGPSPEEIAAAAARGREPGAVGYDGAGNLVQRQVDGSLRVIEDEAGRPAE